jgi:hypothetical protein
MTASNRFISNVFRGVTNEDLQTRECNDWLDALGVIEVRLVSATGVYSVSDITNKIGLDSGSRLEHILSRAEERFFRKRNFLRVLVAVLF